VARHPYQSIIIPLLITAILASGVQQFQYKVSVTHYYILVQAHTFILIQFQCPALTPTSYILFHWDLHEKKWSLRLLFLVSGDQGDWFLILYARKQFHLSFRSVPVICAFVLALVLVSVASALPDPPKGLCIRSVVFKGTVSLYFDPSFTKHLLSDSLESLKHSSNISKIYKRNIGNSRCTALVLTTPAG
jgi:hypothetical protein